MLPLSCPLGCKVGPSIPSQRPASHSDWTGLGHMANPKSSKGLRTLKESISLESHGSPNRIWGTDGRRQQTMVAWKALKKCSLQHLCLYIPSLPSRNGGLSHIRKLWCPVHGISNSRLDLGHPTIELLFCLSCLFLVGPLDSFLWLCLRTPSLC